MKVTYHVVKAFRTFCTHYSGTALSAFIEVANIASLAVEAELAQKMLVLEAWAEIAPFLSWVAEASWNDSGIR